jgi:hypothetical protein
MRDIPEEIYRQVLRRAGNRCEGAIEDPRMRRSAERCGARKDLNLYIGFYDEISDEPLRVSDVHLLCEECYSNSETANQWAYYDWQLAKDD